MPEAAPQNVRTSVSNTILHKTRRFMQAIDKMLSSPSGKAANLVYAEVKLSTFGAKSYKDLANTVEVISSPTKGALTFITVTMVQKAFVAANITTDDERVACANAIASLAGDLTTAAVIAPETVGLGSVIPLVFAAVDSYHVGKACFINNGTHKIHALGINVGH
jgi:hypothetical protein